MSGFTARSKLQELGFTVDSEMHQSPEYLDWSSYLCIGDAEGHQIVSTTLYHTDPQCLRNDAVAWLWRQYDALKDWV